jgi:hypothetical protein
MKFSELLNEKTNESAFVLGAIYGWPLISLDDNKIFAYGEDPHMHWFISEKSE